MVWDATTRFLSKPFLPRRVVAKTTKDKKNLELAERDCLELLFTELHPMRCCGSYFATPFQDLRNFLGDNGTLLRGVLIVYLLREF